MGESLPVKVPFATVEEAVAEFHEGRPIVLVDDEDRENEGDLALPAEKTTPAAINFMAKHGRGLALARRLAQVDGASLDVVGNQPLRIRFRLVRGDMVREEPDQVVEPIGSSQH